MINTKEELEALPVGTVINDGFDTVIRTERGFVDALGENYKVSETPLPATLLISTKISQDKFSELEATIKAALNTVAVSLGVVNDPDQWDIKARAVAEATLKTLGMEVIHE